MTLCDGSFPASQGEHLLTHYIDAMQPPGLPDAFHGEQTGVCAIAMARLQERILAAATPPVLRPTTASRDDVLRHFGPDRPILLHGVGRSGNPRLGRIDFLGNGNLHRASPLRGRRAQAN